MDLRREAEFARDLVAAAGDLASRMQATVTTRDKGRGQGPVTEADLRTEEILLAGIRERFPDDAIVSEETLHDRVPGNARRIWCVDPIDGTREYAEGLPEYACMVGMLALGEPALGALSIPAERKRIWGWRGGGVFLDGEPVKLAVITDPSKAIAIHSRSHKSPRLAEAMRKIAPRSAITAGSVGYKVAQILAGRAHLYLHPRSGTMWWDSVAPAALMMAAGGTVTDADGAPLDYAHRLDHAKGLLFCVPGLAPEVLKRLRP